MERRFICTSCRRETAFDPREAPRFLRLMGRRGTGRRKEVVVHRVRCAACGKEQDVGAGSA